MYTIEVKMDGVLKKEMVIDESTPAKVQRYIEKHKDEVFDFMKKGKNETVCMSSDDDDDDDEKQGNSKKKVLCVDMHNLEDMECEFEYWDKRMSVQDGTGDYKYIVTDTRNMVVVKFKDKSADIEDSAVVDLYDAGEDKRYVSILIAYHWMRYFYS